MGLLDEELNGITKVLFLTTIAIDFVMIVLKGFDGPWYIYMFRFVLLFSYLIPISLRVNLDMGKIFYSWQIQRDKSIAGTVGTFYSIESVYAGYMECNAWVGPPLSQRS